MEDISSMKSKELLINLRKFKQYEDKTDNFIKKSIGGKKPATVAELKKELTQLSTSKNMIKNDNHLQYITSLNIDYLSSLDYVDLQNLCMTDKNLNNICHHDETLRNILYKTFQTQINNSDYSKFYKKNNIKLPTINLPPNFPISDALQSLYDNILKLIYINYPQDMKWPRWVNKEQFKDDMIRNIYWNLYFKITEYLYKKKVIDIKNLKSVHINPILIAFPFVSYNDDEYITDMSKEDNKYTQYVTNDLDLPPLFTEYLMHIFSHWEKPFDEYSGILEDTLWVMLFYRDYSRNALNDF